MRATPDNSVGRCFASANGIGWSGVTRAMFCTCVRWRARTHASSHKPMHPEIYAGGTIEIKHNLNVSSRMYSSIYYKNSMVKGHFNKGRPRTSQYYTNTLMREKLLYCRTCLMISCELFAQFVGKLK